jgi:putative membrane protein
MVLRGSSTTRALTVLGAAVLLVSACKKNDTATGRNESAAGGIAATTDSTTKPVNPSGWTDQSIIAYLNAEDVDEVKVNELAVKKAKTPAVRKLAAQMLADHRSGMKEVHGLATTANVTVDTTHEKAHEVLNKTRDELKDLGEKPGGLDWDKAYIDMQIDEHKEVLDKLTDAAKNTNNQDLKTLLAKVSGKVQEHLTKAEAIKATFK